ncbi:MAG: zinc ribbon domain-containing protein [Gemmatimonadaceae bacterium]|nr:zinc ribbon domain-containing protein [Gemmatimonadaceae bacterium]
MFKSLRVPERLYQIAMWAISLVFASFLGGLGAQIVADLPGVDQTTQVEDFMDANALAAIRATRTRLETAQTTLTSERDSAQLALTASTSAWESAKSSFDAWIATRTATTDPAQDPEVLRRTREVESLKGVERAAQATVERLDATLLRVQQELQGEQRKEDEMREAATPAYTSAQRALELRVFGIRLALTLPLLLVSWWLVRRKRQSAWWPLMRGFVLFSVLAFFVYLVPYLPSYGGYVRSLVGVLACVLVGRYGIKWMQDYLARRAAAEQQSEVARRQALRTEDALKRMALNVCPGCERPIAAGASAGTVPFVNFCVHCGMKLFDDCGRCGIRKNAFFTYCPSCGTGTGATMPDPSPSPPLGMPPAPAPA